jgi:MFS family permease
MSIYFCFVLIAFNVFTYGATRVATTLYAIKLGAQPFSIGMLAATFAVFPVLLSWQAGKLTDRFGTRWPVMLGASANAMVLFVLFIAPSLLAVFLCAAIFGIGCMFYSISMQHLVGSISSVQDRTRNFSNSAIVVSGANAAAPLATGLFIDHWGHVASFLMIAILMLMPVFILAVMGARLPGGSTASTPAAGIRDTLTNPALWPILAASSLAQCTLDMFQAYMPVYGVSRGHSASAIGIVLAASAIGGLLGRLLLTRLISWSREEKVLAYALAVGACGCVVIPGFDSVSALSAVSFVFGFGLYCSQPVALTLIYSRSPRGRAGQALGLRFAMDNAAKMVGPVVLGAAASAIGLAAVFWISAAMLGVGSMLVRRARAPQSLGSS